VLSGIVPWERIIVNPPDSLVDNQLVRFASAKQQSVEPQVPRPRRYILQTLLYFGM
jgi:hypothetical protein